MKPNLVSPSSLSAHLGTEAGGYPADAGHVNLQRGHEQTSNHVMNILVESACRSLVGTLTVQSDREVPPCPFPVMSKGLLHGVVAGDRSFHVLISAHAYLLPQWLGYGVHPASSVD